MPFANCKRVKFKRSPLTEVICQFRFPTILEIEKEVPAKFQDLIIKRFSNANFGLDIPEPVNLNFSNDNPQVNSLNATFGIQQPRKNYAFYSETNEDVVNLTRNFLSFSTRHYEGWESFYETLSWILDAFVKIYGERDLQRIGLRYINAISRSAIGLTESVPWSELINPHLLGMMGDPKLEPYVSGVNTTTMLKCIAKSVFIQIQSGIFLQVGQSSEQIFLLDADTFSTDKNTTNNATHLLHDIHEIPKNFLHYAITPKLYGLLEPEEI